MRIYLIRHGETDWNVAHRYQGHTDTPLNANGRRQGLALEEQLRSEPIRAVYASDLSRTMTFATLIFPRLSINRLATLREINFGEWEGRTYEELIGDAQNGFQEWLAHPETGVIPQGEVFSDMVSRVTTAFDHIRTHHVDDVAIVTHAGVIKVLLGQIMGLPLAQCFRIHQNSGALNIVRVDGDRIEIEMMNGETQWER